MPTIHRGAEASREAKQLGARAFTRDADVYLPAEHGPIDRGPAAALLAHELTHVRQQRQLGSDLPSESTDAGQRLEAEAKSAELSLGRGPSMALPPSGRSSGSSHAAPADGHGSSTSRAADTSSADQGAAGVMRATAAEAPQPTQRAVDAPVTAPSMPQRSEEDLDDLARQLYGRLRGRLRRELLVDRERAGMVTDLR